jgi:tetratricopeptide (TPR) repeat protein
VTGSAVVDAVLAHLVDASLLTFSLDGSALSAHRLTMRVIREQRAHDGTLPAAGAAAIAVLQAMTEMLGPVWQHPQAAKDLTQHIIAITSYLAPGTDDHTAGKAEALLRLRAWAVACLNDLGDYPAQAISIGQELAADSERILGTDHPSTVAARSNLANAYREAGRAAEAIVLHEQTLANREQVLGGDYPDTAAARSNLTSAYREAGRAAEAIALYQRILADRERILGGDHPSTAAARKNLSYACRAAGQAAEAVTWHEQTLADREQVLGSDHPDTLTARNNLANAYRDAGRAAEAIALHEQTLTHRERIWATTTPIP